MALNTKGSGIILDRTVNMFCFSGPNGSSFVLWHCPQCGGAFPDPQKPFWVPIITDDERDRLNALIGEITNIANIIDIFAKLGPPDCDEVLDDGMRMIEFYNLSEVANVECYVSDGNRPICRWELKPLRQLI
jgi:hypothetical protein